MSRDRRSPLKGRPLRNAGQSLDDQLLDVLFDKVMAALAAIAIAALEWWRYYFPSEPSPRMSRYARANAG